MTVNSKLINYLLFRNSLFVVILLTACLFFSLSMASEFKPTLSGKVEIDIQNEWGIDDDNPHNDRNNLFTRIKVSPKLAFGKNFYIDGKFKFEEIQKDKSGDDLFFDNHALRFEELKANYTFDNWHLFAGKFNPAYGKAWKYGRGIFSQDLAKTYEIIEKIGGGASYSFKDKTFGKHTVTASTFFSDTTFLSQTIGTERGKFYDTADIASDTEDFSSYVISVDGKDVAGIKNLYYKLGYRHLAEADSSYTSKGGDETGWIVTLGHVVDLNERISTDILLEYTDITNFEGQEDDRQFTTASIVTTLDKKWSLTVAYTDRDVDSYKLGEHDDHLFEISAGYTFDNGVTLATGWRNTEILGYNDNVIGALARYSFKF